MKPTVKFDRTLVAVLVDEVVHVLLELPQDLCTR